MAPTETIKISGRDLRDRMLADLSHEVEGLSARPVLATVLVGDDPASALYVRMKSKTAAKVGIEIVDRTLPAETGQAELETVLAALNADDDVDGILLQLPLPAQLDPERCLAQIDPAKDVDGFHPVSLGRLVRGQPGLRPCTPAGVMQLIAESGVDLTGKRAVVVGRSEIVGKPVALMLLAAHATVTICHSRTRDLAARIGEADIVVAAAGVPRLVRGAWIREGAVVIDVGTNKLDDGTLVGDVCTEEALGRAAAITPVPGGVGPMTITNLMINTVRAHQARRGEAA